MSVVRIMKTTRLFRIASKLPKLRLIEGQITDNFLFLYSAIVNEVGMLNGAMDTPCSVCAPNGPTQQYLADSQTDNACTPRPSSSSHRASWAWWRLRPHRTADVLGATFGELLDD